MILPSNMKILVVDDNDFARATANAMLIRLGLDDITEAASGAEAVSLLLSERYDLLLADWYMPEVSGAGLVKIVRSRDFGINRTIPIVIATAYATRENIGAARALGLTEILIKPLEQPILATALSRAISLRPADDQVFIED